MARAPGAVLDLELIDDLVLGYLHWKEMCVAVHVAFERWCQCDTSERADAFAEFRSALDREEQAAVIYRCTARRLEACA